MSIILGIESSCDETAIALLKGNLHGLPEVLAHEIYSQIKAHMPYGGVVPEIAARAHLERITNLTKTALKTADIGLNQIDAIAVTSGPGLIGGVIVGLMFAKGLSLANNKPLIAINHLEGHALSPQIEQEVVFPYLLLLASGGHCQILLVEDFGKYFLLGQTLDDAAGEAFDKIAKFFSLGLPGGVKVEIKAQAGDKDYFSFPRPLTKQSDNLNFSFSGLKTAVMREAQKHDWRNDPDIIAHLCASFQQAVSDCFSLQIQKAIRIFKEKYPDKKASFVIAGGVAANQVIRSDLQKLCHKNNFKFIAPSPEFCTDNGVMIAYAGFCHFIRKQFSSLDVMAKARWPLVTD